MKALFVAHCNDLSGANLSFLKIIEQLKHKVDIVVLCNQEDGELTQYLISKKVPVIFADYSWWYIRPRKNIIKCIYRNIYDVYKYFNKNLSADIINKLKAESFDLVYTNTSTINVGAKIADILKIPHIWHVREFGQEDFGFKSILSQEQQNAYFFKASRVIVNSHAVEEKYKQFLDDKKICCIYNGFEIDNIHYNNTSFHTSKIKILVTGQIGQGKGQRQAILAVNQLRTHFINIELYLAGEIDHSYLNPVIREIGGMQSWLHVLGFCKDIQSIRDEMDIELICSRCEAFGRVTLEAMLQGIPVIGARTGATKELITDKETGLLYEYDNLEDLASCIEYLISHEDMYKNIKQKARKFAENFSIEKTSREIYDVFREAVN